MLPDYGLVLVGLLSFAVQIIVLLAAASCACWSLLLLRRRKATIQKGRSLALSSIALSVVAEVWMILLFTPSRFPNAGSLLLLPIFPLALGLLSVALWGLTGPRVPSGIARLALLQLAIGFVVTAFIEIPRWQVRRLLLHQAAMCAADARNFEAASRNSRFDHDAKYLRRFAEHYEAMSHAYLWAANHPGKPLPSVPRPYPWEVND